MTDVANSEFILTTPEDIYGALRKVVLMKTQVRVRIDGSDEAFYSAILETDLKTRSFFFDRLTPNNGNDLIRAGHRFSIECDSQGIRIEFRMTGRLKFHPAKGVYRAEYPEQVLYLQRRSAYRVAIPPSHRIQLRLRLSDGLDLSATLLDLSSGGIKVCFAGDVRSHLEGQILYPIARIRFNSEEAMDCSLEIKRVSMDEKGNTIAGFSISSLSATAQRYLDRMIAEFQWEERSLKAKFEEKMLDAASAAADKAATAR